MAFQFEDWMIHHYMREGYIIFRHVIPDTLLSDLRREGDKVRDLAHQLNGPQTQRIQPLERYGDQINLAPFKAYVELDDIHRAVTALLGNGYTPANIDIMGLLVEPQNSPWHCGWHRDGVVEVPLEARDDELKAYLAKLWYDLRFYNQVNCALYADSSTWYVPGSHLRAYDLPGEKQSTQDPSLRAGPETWSNEKMEQYVLKHCRDMPGAIQTHLDPGDFMIYRNLAWHCGLYLPYQPRATIHDIVSHKDRDPWQEEWAKVKQAAIQRMKNR